MTSLLQRTQTNPYIAEKPYSGKPGRDHVRQAVFLASDKKEILYGGSAGGGKSTALLQAALLYVDEPDYAAILFRRTYSDLALPGALMDRAEQWLTDTDARWHSQEKTWEFPSGATLTFGYLDTDKDRFRYQSAEFQFIGLDELTQFSRIQYLYMFSRLRRKAGSQVPLRMRAGSNPGGIGHEWVRDRWFDYDAETGSYSPKVLPDRLFVGATLDDNPYLDKEAYEEALAELDPLTHQQLRHGNWGARPSGGFFATEQIKIVDVVPAEMPQVRYWDLAATEARPGKDPDWTVGAKLGRGPDNSIYVVDVRRFRKAPAETEERIRQTAEDDGPSVAIWIEQEPGSSGVIAIDHYRRKLLGFPFDGDHVSGKKESRAKPWASAIKGALVHLQRASWNQAFIEEHEAFPQPGVHDDQVDAAAAAFAKIARPKVGMPAGAEELTPRGASGGWSAHNGHDSRNGHEPAALAGAGTGGRRRR